MNRLTPRCLGAAIAMSLAAPAAHAEIALDVIAGSEVSLEGLIQADGNWFDNDVQDLNGNGNNGKDSEFELRRAEITAAIDKILTDVLMLVEFFQANGFSVVVYLTADHGILWRTEHEFRSLAYMGERRPRYARVTTEQKPPAQSTRFNLGDAQYDLFHYPYLSMDIKSNDSGVHGGLSAQESIVPLVTIRG